TDRRGVRPFTAIPQSLWYGGAAPALGTQSDFVKWLVGFNVSYVVELPMIGFAEADHLNGLIHGASSGCLQRVYVLETDARFVVYRTHLQECQKSD
ncbi:MAG: hypothetical protein ABI211_06160, partial [Vicinamibacterales bacterium]